MSAPAATRSTRWPRPSFRDAQDKRSHGRRRHLHRGDADPAGDGGLLLTNSGKFAHYTRPNTGYDVLYGLAGGTAPRRRSPARLVRDEALWR